MKTAPIVARVDIILIILIILIKVFHQSGVFQNVAGRVGSGQEVFEIARVEYSQIGSGGFQVSRIGSGRVGSGRVALAQPNPKKLPDPRKAVFPHIYTVPQIIMANTTFLLNATRCYFLSAGGATRFA